MTTEAVRQVFRTGDSNYTVEQAWSEWQQFCSKWPGTTEASANAQRVPLMNSKVLPDSNNLKFGSRFSRALNLDPNYRLHKIMDSPESSLQPFVNSGWEEFLP